MDEQWHRGYLACARLVAAHHPEIAQALEGEQGMQFSKAAGIEEGEVMEFAAMPNTVIDKLRSLEGQVALRGETIDQLRTEAKMKDELIRALRKQLAEAPSPGDVESDDVPEPVPEEVPQDYRKVVQSHRWTAACDWAGYY